ncbi:hypothetical protein C8Q74DRAFT_1406673 [Fomes fomentarius]|nr:hypothetical protein C8Q74DRAFT_1406673 [Fomes fomentarius]
MSSDSTDTDVATFVTFYAMLYLSLSWNILGFIKFAPFSNKACCQTRKRVVSVSECLQFIPSAAFSALRAFVLSRNKPLSLFVLILGLVPVGINLTMVIVPNYGEIFANIGCILYYELSSETNLKISLIVSDGILILITWRSPMTRGLRMRMHIHTNKRQSLGIILVQNGTIYFIVLLCLNVSHLSFSVANIFGNGASSSDITTFTPPITTILISHFLLDLQEAYRQTVRVDSDDILNLGSNDSTPSFVDRVIGSLGSDIYVATPESDDATGTVSKSENARGDGSDVIQHSYNEPEGHLEDEETTRTGVTAESSASMFTIGRSEKGHEQDGPVARAGTAWQDSEEVLEVPPRMQLLGAFP